MAGHSKWANIKHRKGRQDAKRGKIFSRLIRELTVAARLGGASSEDNPRLRTALDKALSANMTKDTIDRAIQRGSGGEEGENLEEVLYEGYGSGGVAILVETMTDNINRTVAEVRHAFSKAGGNLGTNGSVSYLFKKQGQIQISTSQNYENILDIAIESGAEDIEINPDNSLTIYTEPAKFEEVILALKNASIELGESEITMVPENTVVLNLDSTLSVFRLLEAREDLDDTQNVHSNAELSEELISRIENK